MERIFLLFFLAYLVSSSNPCIQCNGKKFLNCNNVKLDCPTGKKDSDGILRPWTQGLLDNGSTFSEIFLQCMEQFCLCGYVPMLSTSDTCNPIGNSGVTVGAGVDLGQVSYNDLITSYSISDTLANTLKPYLQLTGNDAVQALDDNPLTISQTDAESISLGAENFKYNYLGTIINKYCNFPLSSLSYAQRTALTSMIYQGVFAGDIRSLACNKDWKGLIKYLRNMNDYKFSTASIIKLLEVAVAHQRRDYASFC